MAGVHTINGDYVSKAANVRYRYSVSWLVEVRILWKATVRPDGVILGGETTISGEDGASIEHAVRHAVEDAIEERLARI